MQTGFAKPISKFKPVPHSTERLQERRPDNPHGLALGGVERGIRVDKEGDAQPRLPWVRSQVEELPRHGGIELAAGPELERHLGRDLVQYHFAGRTPVARRADRVDLGRDGGVQNPWCSAGRTSG